MDPNWITTGVTAVATLVVAAATVRYAKLTSDVLQEMRKQRQDALLPSVTGFWNSNKQSAGTAEWATTIYNCGSGRALNLIVQHRAGDEFKEIKRVPVLAPGSSCRTQVRVRMNAGHEIEMLCQDECGRSFCSRHQLNDPLSTGVQYRLEQVG